MASEEQVWQALGEILVPRVTRSIVGLNLVRQVDLSDHKVNITLASAAMSDGVKDWVAARVKTIVGKLPDINEVEIRFDDVKPLALNKVKSIIAVMSGKGGVGKSLVASLMAVALKRQGYQTGILDADITGPSIPRMFGITARPAGSDTGIMPVMSSSGIEVMSMNLLLQQEDAAVIWRGPLISRAITQFWEEVLWGKLDYLIVDLPPGTADASLTVLQAIPISGIILVFTPQDLTAMIVRKAVSMAREMGKPIIGVVENMSYLYVPEIDKKIELFGASRGEEMAQAAGAPLLGRLPVDPELARLCDAGEIEQYNSEASIAMAQAVVQALGQTIPAEAE